VEELSGNVWEWTRSLWGFRYPYRFDDGRENLKAGDDYRRVLRGGSFLSLDDLVRAAGRFRGLPNVRDDDLGFRVVFSPSTTDH
jgi:formylglycine-generating enzyme required for sulfatase activity